MLPAGAVQVTVTEAPAALDVHDAAPFNGDSRGPFGGNLGSAGNLPVDTVRA